MDVIIFFAVLFVLILVHEWGHFIAAKKTGMRVDEFGIGFPPKIKGVKKGETEYTINWLPIGGFVRIWGENYDEEEAGVLTEDQRARAFSARPKWAQAIVLIAGVTMNIVFAWLLFSATFMIGVPTPVQESDAGDDAITIVGGVDPAGPAAELPIMAELRSLRSGGEFVERPSASEFSAFVERVAPEPILVTYVYGEQMVSTEMVPQQGVWEQYPERYALGIQLLMTEVTQQGFFGALYQGFIKTVDATVAISQGLWMLVSQAVMGQADLSQVAGPVGIVGMVGDAASFGITALLMFTAVISLNLAVINLLPFPALDGGRLVFVAIEAITRRRIPPEWAGRVNFVGFAILMLLMVAVTYSDILKLL